MEKKSNHQVNIVRLGEPRVHTNADTLELFDIGGYQVVTKKGEYKAGDLAVYIQPDSVVPQIEAFRFIWEGQKGLDGVVPEKRRRITVRRFRKEWSEGLLMPLSAFPILFNQAGVLCQDEGDDVSCILGITHYDPEVAPEGTKANSLGRVPRRKYPKSLKGWFFFLLYKLGFKDSGLRGMALDVDLGIPVFDVEALKNYRQAFIDGEVVVATEKIHGSNARYVFIDNEFYAGSHYQWKAKGEGIWWKVTEQHPWIEEWCRAHPGDCLYGEVVPTQKGFDYGCKPGETKFFAFAIRSQAGQWLTPWLVYSEMIGNVVGNVVGIESMVPIVSATYFNFEELKKLAEGKSMVEGAKHLREGIVITPVPERYVHRLGRLILKLVSNSFLEKDTKEAN